MENRIVKFRGKKIENNEWVYGNYVYGGISKQHFIVEETAAGMLKFHRIIPETKGQFIGESDKRKKEIYEGDFVTGNWLIKFDGGMFIPFYDFGRQERYEDVGYEWWNKVEVIGNISENKDLISKEEF